MSVLFCDLVGSTARQVRLGDDAADEFRRSFYAELREAVGQGRGEEVKNTGDGLMVVFRHSAVDAVECAVSMHAAVACLATDEAVQIRIGISAGEAAHDDEDWFGTPVNEAARLCAAAQPSQTLTSEVVQRLVGSRGSFVFRSVGALTLKGLPGPVAAAEVVTGVAGAPAVERRGADWPRRRGTKRVVVAAALASAVVIVGLVALIGIRSRSGSPGAATVPTLAHNYAVSYVAKRCDASVGRDVPVPGLECGTLTVPEDRAKPHGRTVRLDVVRAPPREQPTGDPVLDFGTDALTTSPAREHSEEVQLAGRGATGTLRSDPALTCPEYATFAGDALTRRADDLTERQRDVAAIRACYDRWTRVGVDANQYNYLTDGDDMADLVRALHFTRVHLVSGYVATIGALELIRQLPGVVRSLTLQEPVAPHQSAYTNPAKYLSDAFNNYVSLCQADPACKTTFPDLPSQYRRDHDVAGTSPRLVNGDDGNGHTHPILLDADRITQALADALGNRDTYPLIAAAIAAPSGTPVVDAAIAGRTIDANLPLLEPEYTWGLTLSDQCSYDAHTVNQPGTALARQTVPQFAKLDDQSLQWECAAWPVREIDHVAYDEPSTTVPTLIVVPTLQPGADPQWADIFRRGLAHATVLTFPTLDGEILTKGDPPCLATIRRAFLADPTKALDGATCEGQGPPIHFLASLGG